MTPPTLLAVPNVSEGRDAAVIDAIGRALAPGGEARAESPSGARTAARPAQGIRLLDVHSDPDHHRSVFTIAGPPGELAPALLAGARVVLERVDVAARGGSSPTGVHPYVGALDVTPIVYLRPQDRGAACAEALVVADLIGAELAVPVFLYGELTGEAPGRTRAELRRGGLAGLARRMEGVGSGEAMLPQFGPPRMHPTAGATLVAARPPLVAFNVELAPPATVDDARRIAGLIREGGEEGISGLRAIGVGLRGGIGQVSLNIERPSEVPLAVVVEAVARHARVSSAELVGLAQEAALEGFPESVHLRGFDPARQVIEKALGC